MTASIPLHIFFRQKALQNSKKFWRELAERTTKIFKFEPTKNQGKTRKTPIQNAQYAEGFRVRAVITTSIPLQRYFIQFIFIRRYCREYRVFACLGKMQENRQEKLVKVRSKRPKKPCYSLLSLTRTDQRPALFRVSPVMTASIPLHWNSVVLYQLSGKKSRTSEKNLSRF